MKFLTFSLFSALGVLLLSSAPAQAGMHGTLVHHCRLTPADNTPSYPGKEKIVPHNNLALPAGKSLFAPGQLIYLSIRVYDRDCVPLKGAKVELWQTDVNGSFASPDKGSFANPYPLFAGSGMAYADNNGVLGFISVFPGPYGITYNHQKRIRAPHVSMRITHKEFARPHNIEMYFEGDARNLEDPYFQRYGVGQRPLIEATVFPRDEHDINAGLQVYYDITLSEKDPFRHH